MPVLKSASNGRTCDLARDGAIMESAEVLQSLGTSLDGLSEEEAAAR